ncbi:MAG: hypothetical protein IH957_08920 [Chloroflexi bacterium]|nr:hypothetical protein [Chloroflexota bacterium]
MDRGGLNPVSALVVVPCGRSKLWRRNPDAGPTSARDVYTGSPFKVNREYAEKFADRWVILSAKYGFVDPEFMIPADYNVTFNDPRTNPISMSVLRSQLASLTLARFDLVVALGGATYSRLVVDAFVGTGARVISPAAGLPIGKAMSRVKNAVRSGQPF